MGYNSKNRSPAAGQFSCADPVMIAMLYSVNTQLSTLLPPYILLLHFQLQINWAFGKEYGFFTPMHPDAFQIMIQ